MVDAKTKRQEKPASAGFSVALLVSASGKLQKTFAIVKGKTSTSAKKYNFSDKITPVLSPKGWTTQAVMIKLIDHIHTITNFESTILLVDSCKAHLTDNVKWYALTRNINLIQIPENQTGIYQPLDVGVFGPLKARSRFIQHQIKANKVQLTSKQNESQYSKAAYRLEESLNVITENMIQQAFRKACNLEL